ncbi:MAG: hypothetical protein QXJ14_02040 [Candidatus Aenigmatarchaeota archaeon]
MRNIYAGKNSIAKIEVEGIVDTPREVLMIAYALTYDLANLLILDRSGNLRKADAKTINGRFAILYFLMKKFKMGVKAEKIVRKFHNLALARLNGMNEITYVNSIREVALKSGLTYGEIAYVERKVNEVNDYIHNPYFRNIKRVFGVW